MMSGPSSRRVGSDDEPLDKQRKAVLLYWLLRLHYSRNDITSWNWDIIS